MYTVLGPPGVPLAVQPTAAAHRGGSGAGDGHAAVERLGEAEEDASLATGWHGCVGLTRDPHSSRWAGGTSSRMTGGRMGWAAGGIAYGGSL